jgi:hypothetical protein
MTESQALKDNAIFRQPWWLDAVAPGRWDEVVVTKGDEVAARLPYVVKKRYGLTTLTMPPLTQFLGPWLRPGEGKTATRLASEKDLMEELIEGLPRFDHFCQNFQHSVTNWLPFYWKGFTQTTRYTYRLEDLTDLDAIWSGFAENVRRAVRKAEKALSVRTDPGLGEFLRLNALTFSRQGEEVPYSAELVGRLDSACAEREARKMIFAQDEGNRLHAAIYIVWDSEAAYNLMLGSDPELRGSGASSMLMWEAIKFASKVTKAFDFEGSMIESIERSFRSFGATQTPYSQVSRMSRRMRFLSSGRDMLKAISGAG